LPINSTSDTYFLRGTVVDVIPILNTSASQFGNTALTHFRGKPLHRMVKVGIIAVDEVSKKNVIMMTPLINRLFSCESELEVTNVSENVEKVTKAVECWSSKSSAKQVIFTIGGPSLNEVIEKLVDRKLKKVSQQLTELHKGLHDPYYVTVGIRKNSLIVHLPAQVEFARYCLEKLVDHVETIIQILEK